MRADQALSAVALNMTPTRRPTTMDAFETWVRRNRPGTPLERKEGGGYTSATLQAEWLAFAAGWAFRGMLP